MADVLIKSSSAEVVATGTVISFNGEPIEISYGPTESRLKLILIFKSENETSKKLKIIPKLISNTVLELHMYNFDNTLGTGTLRPILIGTLGGKNLYVHLRTGGITPESDKTIHFTLYRSIEKST